MASAALKRPCEIMREIADDRSLLRKVEAYLTASGDSPQTFGTRAAGDSKFVASLRQGRKCSFLIERRVLDWLEVNYKPQDPAHVALFTPSFTTVAQYNEFLAHRVKEEAMLLGVSLESFMARLLFIGAKAYAKERELNW